LMLRDGDAPCEVLMVERHYQIDFASGALVFPGGKLAKEDYDPAWSDHVDAAPQANDSAFRIGAIREAFEESGLLLARHRAARGVGGGLIEAAALEAAIPHRAQVAAGEASFLGLIRDLDLVLALDLLTPFAHWVTPKGMPKRFDTWFYLAVAPAAQIAVCDGHEAVEACWIAPRDALAAAASGARKIIFPTRMNLEMLATADDVETALAQARGRTIVRVEPEVVREESGALVLTIPAEAGYPVTREPLEGNMP
ncbi:MAG: NUDIX hydrolase, partial [Alphaproteobacteria bacterium]|nr:NUDIX hydrolase [Alphaproteobacteria bacterium]